MSGPEGDKIFAGSIPRLYDEFLVPLIFEPYADDLVSRLASRARLARARDRGRHRRRDAAAGCRAAGERVDRRHRPQSADARPGCVGRHEAPGRMARGRRDAAAVRRTGEFDAVVCQFGVMFFPDKAKAFAEARRVLRPGGVFLFNVWDRIEENEFADTVTTALASLFPGDPPRFMARTPHGYHDVAIIARDLEFGGFTASPAVRTVAARSTAASPRIPRSRIAKARRCATRSRRATRSGLDKATDIATEALARRFGPGPVRRQDPGACRRRRALNHPKGGRP